MQLRTRIASMLRLVAGLARVRDEDGAMREEIAFHLEMQASKLQDAGMNRNDARRAAAIAFGGQAQWSEASRDEYRSRPIEEFVRDIRYGLRSLRRQPTFTVAVILILAIGIGANTATFAVIDALLLRALPVPHPEQLVTIGDPAAVSNMWGGSPQTDYVSYPLYKDVRDRNHVLSGLYAAGPTDDLDVLTPTSATDPNAVPEHPQGRLVSGNFFSVLGVTAYTGRTFTDDDDRTPLSDPVVVISYSYWQRRFNRERSAIGSTLLVNGASLTIIGIAPPAFTGDVVGLSTDLWIPMMMQPAIRSRKNFLDDRESSWLQMMGRLAPGVTLAQARAELTQIEAQSVSDHLTAADLAEFHDDLKMTPIRVGAGSRGFSHDRDTYGAALVVLMAAVVLLMVLVCANVANLMLTRAIARAREMTVRMSLGAGRQRLVRQLLTESLLLAVAAGICGLAVAAWGSRQFVSAASGAEYPIQLNVAPSAATFGLVAFLMLACTLLFGLVPALHATRMDLATALRTTGRSVAGGRSRFGRFATAKLLLVSQVAISAVLLVGAALLVRSMQRIVSADLGLDRDHLVVAHVYAGKTGYTGTRMNVLIRDLATTFERQPGAARVSYSQQGIFSGGMSTTRVRIPGYVAPADSDLQVNRDDVGPSYFTVIGARMIRGRDFDTHDDETGAKVVVINQTMANAYFRGADPIGRTIEDDGMTLTIVGVVRDIEENDLRATPVRRFYASIFQSRTAARTVVLEVRTKGEPARIVESIRAAMLTVDRRLTAQIVPLNDLVRDSVSKDVLLTQVTALFGIVALLVVALGLYGVTSYATAQRTSEFGVRMALGAEPGAVAGLVIREALTLSLIGIAIGVPAGLVAARVIRGQLFGIGTLDFPSMALAALMLCATAAISAYIPARRAARVGPLGALRDD